MIARTALLVVLVFTSSYLRDAAKAAGLDRDGEQILARARATSDEMMGAGQVRPEKRAALTATAADLGKILDADAPRRLKGQPELLESYILRARFRSWLGEFEESISDARSALDAYPESNSAKEALAEALFTRGNREHQEENYARAIADFRASIALLPKSKYHSALAASLARAAVVPGASNPKKMLSEAIVEAREAVRRDPMTSAWQLNLGQVLTLASAYHRKNKDNKESAQLAESAVFVSPAIRTGYINRMDDYFQAGKFTESFRDGDTAVSLSPHDHPLRRRVNMLRAERAESLLKSRSAPNEEAFSPRWAYR